MITIPHMLSHRADDETKLIKQIICYMSVKCIDRNTCTTHIEEISQIQVVHASGTVLQWHNVGSYMLQTGKWKDPSQGKMNKTSRAWRSKFAAEAAGKCACERFMNDTVMDQAVGCFEKAINLQTAFNNVVQSPHWWSAARFREHDSWKTQSYILFSTSGEM